MVLCLVRERPAQGPYTLSIEYRLAAWVWRCCCWLGLTPLPILLSVQRSLSFRLSEESLLHVPFARTSTVEQRAFLVVGPSIWNDLPLSLRSLPRTLSQAFPSHSFIPAISIAPLQVLYHSEALPTTAQILYRSFTPKRTGNFAGRAQGPYMTARA